VVGDKKKESKHEMFLRTQGAGKVAETISNNQTKSNESSGKHQVEILSKYVDVVNSSTCGASNANGESNMSGDSNASENTSGRDSDDKSVDSFLSGLENASNREMESLPYRRCSSGRVV